MTLACPKPATKNIALLLLLCKHFACVCPHYAIWKKFHIISIFSNETDSQLILRGESGAWCLSLLKFTVHKCIPSLFSDVWLDLLRSFQYGVKLGEESEESSALTLLHHLIF